MERTQVKAKLWLADNKDEPIMGDGKAALLKAIEEEGSLNKACKKVKISYKHAWLMLKEIEESVGEPIIIKKRGGKAQGTSLTEKAISLLDTYNTYQNILAQTVYDNTFWEVIGLKISARNQMRGKIIEVKKEGLIASIKISIEPTTITAVITKEAADALDIKKDDKAVAIVKATEVMIGKE
ncbi:molybdenum-pterin binding domain [Candidatus Methanoperedens nitroreducens]|uniref:Molybdenum-pterin binding domain n=1 Tax=Candidatus Methanoperedens nitratireducens TaxID=1392998 RepID=A0A062V708_9EURY|nr:TOBE domain-containing protein [Candidatus Methanoperedens nitroreducens]KCZ73097.1 molybdenum-pterin binding domain [Candidatus Methanoperedens nitroreducens]MDJ1422957.1 TOBE domain-containing protein [Candidatus Methanoperedens sp.]